MAKAKQQAKRHVVKADGIQNVITGLGTSRDKRSANSWSRLALDPDTAEMLWQGSWLLARVVETEGEMMFRQGFKVRVTDDAGLADKAAAAINDVTDELGISATFIDAIAKSRAMGGSAIWLGADDGQPMSEPLNLEGVKSLPWLKVLNRRECFPHTYESEPTSPRMGEVLQWAVMPEVIGGTGSRQIAVHHSRLVPLFGVVTTMRQRQQNNGWGASVLDRVVETMLDLEASYGNSAHLIQDFAQAVYRLKGLSEALGAGEDELVKNRVKAIDQMRSALRGILLDAEDEFERASTPVSGLPELLDRLATRVAAAADMPVSLLFGQAPAGLNATGDANTRWYYDGVAGRRELRVRKPLNYVLKVLLAAKDGPTGGKQPAKWRVEFPSLYQLTEGEKADIRQKVAQADVGYVNAGVLLPEEVAQSRFGGDEYSQETHLDEEARALLPDAVDRHEEQQANQEAAAQQQQPPAQ